MKRMIGAIQISLMQAVLGVAVAAGGSYVGIQKVKIWWADYKTDLAQEQLASKDKELALSDAELKSCKEDRDAERVRAAQLNDAILQCSANTRLISKRCAISTEKAKDQTVAVLQEGSRLAVSPPEGYGPEYLQKRLNALYE